MEGPALFIFRAIITLMAELIALLETYRYLILLPLTIIEGPLVTVAAGFLITLDIFDFFPVLAIVILGDAIGDSFYYFVGRSLGTPFLRRFGSRFWLSEEKLAQAREFFSRNQVKALAILKFTHGLGFSGLLAAGALRLPYGRFWLTCFGISAIKSLLLLLLAELAGVAYLELSRWLSYFGAATLFIGLALLAYLLWRSWPRLPKNGSLK